MFEQNKWLPAFLETFVHTFVHTFLEYFLIWTFVSRRKQAMCTRTWVYMGVCVGGGWISIHKVADYIQTSEDLNYAEGEIQIVYSEKEFWVLRKCWVKQALSGENEFWVKAKNIVSNWTFTTASKHTLSLSVFRYFLHFLIPVSYLNVFNVPYYFWLHIGIQDHLKPDPTFSFQFYFSFYPLANESFPNLMECPEIVHFWTNVYSACSASLSPSLYTQILLTQDPNQMFLLQNPPWYCQMEITTFTSDVPEHISCSLSVGFTILCLG